MSDSEATSFQPALLTPATSNFMFDFDMDSYEEMYPIMVLCLKHSSVSYALSANVTISHKAVNDLVNSVSIDDKNKRFAMKIGNSEVKVYKRDFCKILCIPNPEATDDITPLMMLKMFIFMGHTPELMMVTRFRNTNIPPFWGFLFSALYRCLTGVTSNPDL